MSHQYSLKGDCYHCANYTNCYSGQSKICIIYFSYGISSKYFIIN